MNWDAVYVLEILHWIIVSFYRHCCLNILYVLIPFLLYVSLLFKSVLFGAIRSCSIRSVTLQRAACLKPKAGSFLVCNARETSRQWVCECESESEWDPAWTFYTELFLNTHPFLISVFPPEPLRKPVWPRFLHTRGQIREESENDCIETHGLCKENTRRVKN